MMPVIIAPAAVAGLGRVLRALGLRSDMAPPSLMLVLPAVAAIILARGVFHLLVAATTASGRERPPPLFCLIITAVPTVPAAGTATALPVRYIVSSLLHLQLSVALTISDSHLNSFTLLAPLIPVVPLIPLLPAAPVAPTLPLLPAVTAAPFRLGGSSGSTSFISAVEGKRVTVR